MTSNLARRPLPESLDSLARRAVARRRAAFPDPVLLISQNHNNRESSYISSSPIDVESIPSENTSETVSSTAEVPTLVPASPRSDNRDTLSNLSARTILYLARRPLPESLDSLTRRAVARRRALPDPVLLTSQNHNRESSYISSSPIDVESIPTENTLETVSSTAEVPTLVPASPLSDNGDTLSNPSARAILYLARRPLTESLDRLASRNIARRPTVPATFIQTYNRSHNNNDLELTSMNSSPNNNAEDTMVEKNNFEDSSEFDNHFLNKCVKDELQCNICQEILIKPTLLNCGHAFCHGCIESWTRIRNTCPLCRASVTSKTYCRPLDTFLNKISPLLSKELRSKRQSRIEEYNITP